MKKIHLSGIDLNLLVIFDALAAEGNATRAAARLGMTQPAVSHALARLRRLLGDTLFIRTAEGMQPTQLAAALTGPVRDILQRTEALFAPRGEFSAGGSTRRFTLGMSDYAAAALLPHLLEIAAREAPNIRFTVRNTAHASGSRMLEEDEAELTAGNFPAVRGPLRSRLLYEEYFVCAAREGHPAFRKRLTMKGYLALQHLQISTAGSSFGYVDTVLKKRGLQRDVRVTAAHFLAAPLLLRSSDLTATEPARLFAAAGTGLNAVKPPFPIPGFPVTMNWHARHDSDPGHVWLRELLQRSAGKKTSR